MYKTNAAAAELISDITVALQFWTYSKQLTFLEYTSHPFAHRMFDRQVTGLQARSHIAYMATKHFERRPA